MDNSHPGLQNNLNFSLVQKSSTVCIYLKCVYVCMYVYNVIYQLILYDLLPEEGPQCCVYTVVYIYIYC